MKTPRDLLLARHQEAQASLDEVRRRALAEIDGTAGQPAREFTRESFFGSFLHFFALPKPAWGALAAAWVVIIALNLASRESGPASAAPVREAKRAPENLQALHEQHRLFAELVGTLKNADAEPPRFLPRPQGAIQSPYLYV